jgi:hypothetical protein
MKTKKPILLVTALLLLFFGTFTGCKKIETGLSAIRWEIDFDLVTTTWDIQFIDAATGLSIGAGNDDEISVTVSGADAGNIIDLAGIRQPVYLSTKGFMAMALHPDRPTPGTQAPVTFVIHAAHPDYLPAVMPVITHREGINPVKVYLVKRTSSPANVDLVHLATETAAADGRLTGVISATTPRKLVTLTVDEGTVLTDAGGARLSGNIAVTIAGWEGATVNGLRTLPGGQISLSTAGKAGLIYLAAGVYADLSDRNGLKAGILSKPMTCAAEINPAVYNPTSRIKVAAGQPVPVWFMNPETGAWESKGTTLLTTDGTRLLASFSMSGPGLYAAGWIQESLCAQPLLLRPGTLPEYSEIPFGFTLNFFEVFENEFRFIRTAGISGQVNTDTELRLLPDNAELLVRFESYAGETSPYYRSPDPLLLTGFCGSTDPVSLELLPKPNSTFRKIEVVFIDVAHNNTRYNPKVFPGYYRKPGDNLWQAAFVHGGISYMVNPQEGAVYEMGINFKGKLHKKDVTIGSEDVVLVEIDID